MAGYAVLMNVHAALQLQGKRMEQVVSSEPYGILAGQYASAMLEGGLDLMEQSAQSIDMTGLATSGVEAVMAARSAIHGAKLTLQSLATNADKIRASDDGGRQIGETMTKESLEFFNSSVGQIEHSAGLLLKSIKSS